MQKEEILERSRRENKSRDSYEKQVVVACGNAGVFIIPATGFTVKAIKLRRRHEIAVAALCWAGVVLFSAAHLYQLITASTIL